MSKPVRSLSVLLVCCAFVSGCVERRIRVTSEPSGARVWLNDQHIGTTPCEARFKFYGKYDVRIELDEHEPIHEGREAYPPIYEYPGIDLAATALPLKLENVVKWHYTLERIPTGPEAREALRERSLEMRAMSGVVDEDESSGSVGTLERPGG